MIAHPSSHLLAKLADFAVRRRWPVLIGFLAAMLLSLLLATRLEFQSSRYSLVDPDNSYQARMLGFFERFGHPDVGVFIIEGENADARRDYADGLARALERRPEFAGRVMYRLDADVLAEVLLTQDPQAVLDSLSQLPAPEVAGAALSRGIPGMLDTLATVLEQGLEGEGSSSAQPERLGAMLPLARALAGQVAGDDPSMGWRLLASAASTSTRREGVDDFGYLSASDGSFHLLTVMPVIETATTEELAKIVGSMREVQAQQAELADTLAVTSTLSGLPVLTVDEEHSLRTSLATTTVATTTAILLLLWIGLGNLRQAVLSLVPLGIASALSLGALELLYGHVNVVTSSFLAVLLGLGIDFSVHFFVRFREERAGGSDAPIVAAFRGAGPGMATGMATTAIAFLCLANAQFTAYGEMGVITAVGLVLVFLATLMLLPGILSTRWMAQGQRTRDYSGTATKRVAVIFRRPSGILWLCLLLTIVAAGLATRSTFNARYFDFLPQDAESSRGLRRLESDKLTNPLFAYFSADSIEQAQIQAEKLRSLSSVGVVETPSDLLPATTPEGRAAMSQLDGLLPAQIAGYESDKNLVEAFLAAATRLDDALDEVLHELRRTNGGVLEITELSNSVKKIVVTCRTEKADCEQRVARLEAGFASVYARARFGLRAVASSEHLDVSMLPPHFQRRFGARDGSKAVAVYVFARSSLWAPGEAKLFAEQVESVAPGAAGHAMSLHYHNEMILGDFRNATGLAFFLVVLLVWIDFRRVSDVALAMIDQGDDPPFRCKLTMAVSGLAVCLFDCGDQPARHRDSSTG